MEWLGFFPPISNWFKFAGAVRPLTFWTLLSKLLKITLPRGSPHPALQESKAPLMLCVVVWASLNALLESS